MYNLDVTAGTCIPLRHTVLSIGAGWRKQLNRHTGVMQESRFSVSFNLTFSERLFRGKIE